jgi:hypothetical protein
LEPTNADSTRKLLLWSASIVLGYFVAVLWHLLLLVKVQPSTPRFFPPLLILFNLFPIAGLVALAKGAPQIGWKHDYSSSCHRTGRRHLRTFSQFRHRQHIAHAIGRPETLFSGQCSVAGPARGAWLLDWDSHIRAFVGATRVENLKQNGVGRLNWCRTCHAEGEFNVAEY